MSQDAQGDGQEKTLDPTPSRLDRARREGDVPQSKEATAAASYLAFYVVVLLGAGAIAAEASQRLLHMLQDPVAYADLMDESRTSHLVAIAAGAAAPAGLLLAAPFAGSILSVIAQRAIVFAPKKLKPQVDRISILKNAKKKFGSEGLGEFVKAATKLAIVCGLLAFLVLARMETLPGEARLPASVLPGSLHRETLVFLGAIVLFSFAIAVIDFPWTQYQYKKRLRMSREEVKKEQKENEGDPHLKQKRQEKGRTIAENRMMLDVPKADVVLVNPTHYAVALTWARTPNSAPVCVAKGVDEVARRIREAAALSGVPIRSDPPTARAIWASVDIGETIRPEHYKAVAAAIHFADKLRAASRERGEAPTMRIDRNG